ncbi:Inositol 2-dehydrogenase/D-chiro-inositol 3-dehydrogenase [subsurface metagenome]
MTRVLQVGIIGCGRIANQIHIPIWRRIKNVEIAAVCDKNEEMAKKTMNRLKIRRSFTELSNMLDDVDIDIIDNCTPVALHASIAIQAMNYGCHVLVEKPMALRSEEADKLIQVSNKRRVKLGIIHNTLFNPAVVKAKRLIHEGRIGEIIGIDVKYVKGMDDDWILNKNHWSHKLPGGIFGEILAHPIYLERAFLGDLNVVEVHIRKLGNLQWLKSDELRVIVDGRKGIGTITLSLNSPRNEGIIDIYGTNMNLHLNLWTGTIIKQRPTILDSLSLGKDSLNQAFQGISNTLTNATKFLLRKFPNGHQILIPQFVEAVRHDSKTLVTAEDGREVVKVLAEITDRIEKQVEALHR